ncbi:MAG: hypothetical protein ACI3YJ_02630, partial [Prevotella sp.]
TIKHDRMDLYETITAAIIKEHARGYCIVEARNDGHVCMEDNPEEYEKRVYQRRKTSFRSELTQDELQALASLCNDMGIFSEPAPVTTETLTAFFSMEHSGLRVRKIRLLCVLLSSLSYHGLIARNWQAPIYQNNLIAAFRKDGSINRSDLTTAHNAINNVLMDERVCIIEKAVKQLANAHGHTEKH